MMKQSRSLNKKPAIVTDSTIEKWLQCLRYDDTFDVDAKQFMMTHQVKNKRKLDGFVQFRTI